MELRIYKDYNSLSEHCANEIINQVKAKPNSVICLAAGDTPRMTYSLLTKKATEEKIDFSRCTIIGLDEWIGVPPENEGSCQFFLRSLVLDPLKIFRSQIHLFDVMSGDLKEECQKMDEAIAQKKGIDLIVVGVGMNGHIGFNEPGVAISKYSHVIDLDETTQTVGQKYFKDAAMLKKGITLGLKHLLEARKAILIASGIKKAEVIRKAVEGEISTELPASIMRKHADGWIMIDEDAASLLRKDKIINY